MLQNLCQIRSNLGIGVLVGNNIDPRDVSSFAAMIAANGDKGIFNEKI